MRTSGCGLPVKGVAWEGGGGWGGEEDPRGTFGIFKK